MKQYPSIVSIVVLLYCAWQGKELIHAWGSHQHFALGSIAFTIWCIPPLLYLVIPSANKKNENLPFLYLAVILSTMGVLGTFNTFRQMGVAFAIAGFIPFSIGSLVWLITSVSWMSLFAYFMSSFDPIYATVLRLFIASIGSLFGCYQAYRLLRRES